MWARLNFIQATPGVSWGTGAVVGTGGWYWVWNKCRWGDGVMRVTEMERVWCG